MEGKGSLDAFARHDATDRKGRPDRITPLDLDHCTGEDLDPPLFALADLDMNIDCIANLESAERLLTLVLGIYFIDYI